FPPTGGELLADSIRTLVATMNPTLPILSMGDLGDQSGPEVLRLRVAAAVSGSIGIVGLLLAAFGIYGVTGYAVARRTREFGIRIAMGAQRADVVGMVV